ncbi:hypothetical protein Q8W38_12980 [Vibrio splendidus]|uniref:ABC transporter permease n=1 Tax=Vibrio splendidus TaxID=29497 RepID=A0ABD5AAT5_VIBSP|nr:hypothetical protein [Vibrio splendidus]MDP2490255.1 hypothetical protein [Vibrio splendidus]PMO56872.1 hypothetical protein BCT08_09010 [Vibrio splendidus]
MSVINRFKANNKRTIDFFRAIPSLFKMFREQTDIPVVKIALLVFCSKFINMIVMFIPLKMLFVLSGSKNIAVLHEMETSLGRDVYIGGMLVIIAILYFFSVVVSVYQIKLVNSQRSKIESKDYYFRSELKSKTVITQTYPLFCQILADFLLIGAVIIVLFIVNIYYALYYFAVVMIYTIIVEQWAFSTHQSKLMNRLGIDSKQFIKISGVFIFFLSFVGILAIVLNMNIAVIIAVLMLILVRLANSALKSFFNCQIKLRTHFI